MKICTENTHNYWGGLDRARILNTSVYSGIKFAHSVMFSLSKGLSAHIGEDHRKARIFAEGLGLDPKLFPMNIVILEVEDAQEFIYKLKERGVLALAISRREDDTDIWVRG
ncbi:MAG: hypothetical protein ACO2O5_07375 [Candidatus Caldipriscus sp.]